MDSDRLVMVVLVVAKAQLVRLARHYRVTQREMLARLLAEAERGVLDGLGGGEAMARYLD